MSKSMSSDLLDIDKNLGNKFYRNVIKRILDVVLSILGIALTFPIILVAGIAIKIDSSGPVFYRQVRLGEKNKTFRVFKLRTMYENSSIGNLNAPTKGDTRVTKVGYFLRKTSIDELPQLLNVLLGDMSIIGPRAVPPKEIELRLNKLNEKYPEDEILHDIYMYKRGLVKPGISGMAQAYGRSQLTTLKATEYDVYYSENVSFSLDIKIIIETVKTVFLQKGVN